ncbi:MAG: hypothetical protein IKR98_07455 [Bacteroidaceae bacterium]|nr:hypothetical protein [Bacteroidaceae bacterium]
MKLKKLFAAALLVCSTGAWAQTDVTSTYLTNADFSSSTPIGSNLKGYGKDGTPYGFQSVDGWTSKVTSGDNSNNSYPNSGMGGAVFAYGSSYQLQGNSKAAPATNPNGEASGNCLGFFGVWGCGGYYYQTVTLAAGKYTITVPMYNQSGTQANTTYTGFFPTSGTNRTVAVNPTVGQWVNQTVTFTLADATEGQIRIGYQSTGNGSGANPMLFIDCVKIEFTAIVVRDVLETAITAATTVNSRINNTDLTTAITTAQAVYNDENATQDEVNAAAATLNTAVETAMASHITNGGDATLALTNSDLSSLDGWTVASTSGYNDKGNGLIGTYNVRFSAATVDDTHLATEYCLGFEARWSGNYASYNQTTVALPAGVYTLTYDVENVNGSTSNLTYADYNFVQVGETKNYSSATEWMAAKSGWTTHTIRVTLNEPAPITVSFGYGTGDNNSPAEVTPALYVSHVNLSYSSFLDGAKAAYDEAVANAATAKSENPNVIGSELAALNAELAKSEPTTVDGYNAATEDINDAIDELVAAAPAYNALVTEIAYAKTLNVGTDDAEAAMEDSEATAASVTTATQTLKEDEYWDLLYAYPNDVTSFLGEWPAGNYGSTSGQSYQGGSETYFDTWSGSATDLTSSKTVEQLPAGKYVVRVAGRGVTSTTMNLSVKVGDAEAISTPFLMIGDAGKGIDTDGATNFSDGGTYSNSNIGRGWQYRYITFTTDGTAEVVISINGHLNGGTWQSFYAPVLLCDDATYAPIAVDAVKAELQAAIDAAPAVRTANIGDGAFQIKQAGVTAYSDALDAATAAKNAGDATIESINAAKTALATAIETYNNLEVNKPDAEKVFNIILTADGWTYDGKAITFLAGGNPTAGNYAIQYKEAPNTNLAQAFTFTKVEGNKYKMSQIDADGVDRYISTGVTYGGNTSQIRTVTEADKALLVEVIPTNVEGVYNLRNTEANNYIGSQDAGVYTVNSHIDFSIVETTKPSIAINTSEAGWGTTFLPFAVAALPTDVKAYTCAAVDVNTLTLVEVDALEANKPYIIEGSWNEILKGDAQGTELTHKEGLLTGTYAQIAAPNGSYILQNQNDKVGFYLVDTEVAQPNVPANRAYLTVGGDSSVKAFFLNDTATGINGVMNEIAAGKIYDLGGRKVAKMQKGQTYIIGNKKVNVK